MKEERKERPVALGRRGDLVNAQKVCCSQVAGSCGPRLALCFWLISGRWRFWEIRSGNTMSQQQQERANFAQKRSKQEGAEGAPTTTICTIRMQLSKIARPPQSARREGLARQKKRKQIKIKYQNRLTSTKAAAGVSESRQLQAGSGQLARCLEQSHICQPCTSSNSQGHARTRDTTAPLGADAILRLSSLHHTACLAPAAARIAVKVRVRGCWPTLRAYLMAGLVSILSSPCSLAKRATAATDQRCPSITYLDVVLWFHQPMRKQ